MKDRTKTLSLPPSFLSDLSAVYEGGVQLRPEFFRDLQYVWNADPYHDVSIDQLKNLESELKDWSSRCDAELKRELSKLPDHHPVKCPISLFGTMDYGRFEVAHTRTLAWLLNPKEPHGFGNALLVSLLRHLLGWHQLPRFEVLKVNAERFYRNSVEEDAGRNDIWVEGYWRQLRIAKPWLVVIEAKIDMSEDDEQLERYDRAIHIWQTEHDESTCDIHRVFLTPEGTQPKCGGGRWIALSFSTLARVFCRAATSLTTKPGHDFLRCYLAGIMKDVLDLPIGHSDGHQNRYKLLGFVKGLNATNARRTEQ